MRNENRRSYFTVSKVFLGLGPILATGLIGSFLRKHRFTREGYADLHTPDLDKVKWVRKQIRTVMLWEFFLLYLLSVKVIPEAESI